MKIKLSYGKTGLDVDIDDKLNPTVYRKKKMPRAADPDAAVAESLASPIGSKPLREIAAGKKTACIVVNDITRPVPNKLILPHIISELKQGGLTDDGIFLLNATGTHRPADDAEIVELVGADIAAKHKFYNHDCHDDACHQFLGTTHNGTEVHIDTRYLDADVKILTGLIEPHFMAGYSGGRKVVCPGIASIKSVKKIHSPQFMENRAAGNCNVADNPLHDELVGIARLAGVDYIVNVVIDEERHVCGVYSGDFEAAHLAGVAFAKQFDMVDAEGLADIVITSSAGYPLDKTYYQAVKGICGVTQILRPGGTIIIAAECSEGMGNDTFVKCLKDRANFETHFDYVHDIECPEAFTPDQWQVEKLSLALEKGRVILVSGRLSDEDFALTLAERAATVEEALAASLQMLKPSAKIAIVPEGPYVIPFLKGA